MAVPASPVTSRASQRTGKTGIFKDSSGILVAEARYRLSPHDAAPIVRLSDARDWQKRSRCAGLVPAEPRRSTATAGMNRQANAATVGKNGARKTTGGSKVTKGASGGYHHHGGHFC